MIHPMHEVYRRANWLSSKSSPHPAPTGPHPLPLSHERERGDRRTRIIFRVSWGEGAKLEREGRVRTDGEGEEMSVAVGG